MMSWSRPLPLCNMRITHQSTNLNLFKILARLMHSEKIVLNVEIDLEFDRVAKCCCHSLIELGTIQIPSKVLH